MEKKTEKSKFRKLGPCEVSEDCFEAYAKLKIYSVDLLYATWANENNADGVRILALRDMLRQLVDDERLSEDDVYYTAHTSIRRLFYLRSGDKDATTEYLCQMLRERPKLLKELVAEFEYNLENQFYSGSPADRDIAQALIELLMCCVTEESVARNLSVHHKVYEPGIALREWKRRVQEIIYPKSTVPEWFREEWWGKLYGSARGELARNPKGPDVIHGDHIKSAPEKWPATGALLNFIVDTSYQEDEESICSIEPVIRFFVDTFPPHVTCLSYANMVNVLPYLHDEDLALKVARRNIDALLQYSAEERDAALKAYCHTDMGGAFAVWLCGLFNMKSEMTLRIDAVIRELHNCWTNHEVKND